MSDSANKPTAENTPPTPPAPWGSPSAGYDPTEALKVRLEETRLPADLKAQILAELPPPEERDRRYRELRETGGLSFEQLCESLGIEVNPQP